MTDIPETEFSYNRNPPAIVVVDEFYRYPDRVEKLAREAEYMVDDRYFKGHRTKRNYLFPYVKEEFERLLQLEITDWMRQPANGVFQQTTAADPLVWHSDQQDYAAAVYLTQERTDAGTSFWKYATGTERRPSASAERNATLYSEYNLTHPDHWELVDKVGSVFNRLVIWDAKLIHSASTYGGFSVHHPRLVQLFFFSVKRRASASTAPRLTSSASRTSRRTLTARSIPSS
jgi:hypothetical protein